MNVDELRRELQHQADEARLWPVPRLADLEAVRRRQRRRTTATTVLAVAATAAVVAVVPQLLPGDRPAGSGEVATSPTPSPTATSGPSVGVRTWTRVDCPPRQARDCTAPAELSLGGVTYRYEDGGDVPTRYNGGTSTRLDLSVSGPGRSVLVGAAGSREGSRLTVRIGSGKPLALQPGKLTLLPIDDSLTRPVEVVVTEDATPVPDEVLTIGVYHPVS